MCLFTAHPSSPKPSNNSSLLPRPVSGCHQALTGFLVLECLNWKDPDTPAAHCTDRETGPETARDSSEVPQLVKLGLGLRWYLSAPFSSLPSHE